LRDEKLLLSTEASIAANAYHTTFVLIRNILLIAPSVIIRARQDPRADGPDFHQRMKP